MNNMAAILKNVSDDDQKRVDIIKLYFVTKIMGRINLTQDMVVRHV